MEPGKELRGKETGSNDKVKKKRGRSAKRFGAVHFPGNLFRLFGFNIAEPRLFQPTPDR